MRHELRIGIIGLDTSHAAAFTKILHDTGDPNHVPGAKVVAAYPSSSPDIELSRSRVDEVTRRLREELAVEIVESIDDLCRQVDAILLESLDGRRHLPEIKPVLDARKPCFVDKPLTASLVDARELARLVNEAGVPVFSSSSLRFTDEVQSIVSGKEGVGQVEHVHVFSPATLEPTNPGLYWYGIHGVEMLYSLMGPGCRRLRCLVTDQADRIWADWADGRTATLTGTRVSQHAYGAVVHGSAGTRAFVCRVGALYVPLVRRIVEFFKTGAAPVPLSVTVEMMAFIDAALRSGQQDGTVVDLSESPD